MTGDKTGQILVVDDDPMFRLFARLALERAGYSVVAAADAAAACDQLANLRPESFACVLADYRMPTIDGMQLISRVRKLDPSLAAILVTAEGEKRVYKETLDAGAVGFLDKPVKVEALRHAVAEGAAKTTQQRQVVRMHRSVEEAGEVQRAALAFATRQQDLGFELCYHPKHEAGGDFVAHHRFGSGPDIVLMTDVSGHDLPAAVLLSHFHGFSHGLLSTGAAVEDVLREYNGHLIRTRSKEGRVSSIAALALLLDRAAGRMISFSFGAPTPAWTDGEGRVRTFGQCNSEPLGWFDDAVPSVATASLADGPIWLWTDGVDEVADQLGASIFSLIHSLFAEQSAGTKPGWLRFANDDILVARIWPDAGQRGRLQFRDHPLVAEHYGREQIAEIDLLQGRWQRSLSVALPQLREEVQFAILLSGREALLNALKHGCCKEQSASFQIDYSPASRLVRLRISDPGTGYDIDTERKVRIGKELTDGHRGLALIEGLASRVIAERRGADLTLEFALD